jgi:hypothetical protein
VFLELLLGLWGWGLLLLSVLFLPRVVNIFPLHLLLASLFVLFSVSGITFPIKKVRTIRIIWHREKDPSRLSDARAWASAVLGDWSQTCQHRNSALIPRNRAFCIS